MSEALAIDGLPPLRQVIDSHGLATKKSLGQNFLLDLNLTGRIARTAGDLSELTVIEVGPGPGGLTRALLMHGAKQVIAIERDSRCLPVLAEISDHYGDRLKVIEGDALEVDLASLASGPTAIVANLPYNIGTQLLVNWLSGPVWPPFFQSLTLMFQREVAQRIVATAGDNHFGRLGVLAGWRCHSEIAFDVSPQAFWPPPKVTSSVVHLTPRQQPIECDGAALEMITRHAFGQRRKMLRQSLKPIGGIALLDRVGIDGTRRAETLEIEEFCALANAFKQV
ncbi:16S rRNA (adenine(1518)-N(6)/adenine(1519)-N(6))-dimethyltransferase RsmA [Ahrensia sp. 13_GOM-1096m]|uniref:16S rRNA (adenine(1518)-N(6)/adenine(1519)-N(6))- dimethyltransferase RsmA n=1 Tax=Ahrensia sp. 13_GOM-1096m TaxID=1380380 RepID=UPI00047EDC20|nr:16S rRNA (adenine(1518)-N(6)/adenine(1519)-N(6))-dimethyltransferase RsmA [Ahrensia sp. 13_GOM-1096m]